MAAQGGACLRRTRFTEYRLSRTLVSKYAHGTGIRIRLVRHEACGRSAGPSRVVVRREGEARAWTPPVTAPPLPDVEPPPHRHPVAPTA